MAAQTLADEVYATGKEPVFVDTVGTPAVAAGTEQITYDKVRELGEVKGTIAITTENGKIKTLDYTNPGGTWKCTYQADDKGVYTFTPSEVE